jgi:hypothetical protein
VRKGDFQVEFSFWLTGYKKMGFQKFRGKHVHPTYAVHCIPVTSILWGPEKNMLVTDICLYQVN